MRSPGQPERFGKRAADDDVRKRRELGDERHAGELGVRLVDEDDRLARHLACDRSNRLQRHRDPGRVVGIGQEDDARARANGGEDLVEREREVRPRHHLHEVTAGDRRVEAKDLERRLRHDRLVDRTGDRRSEVRHRQRHDAFVESVGERDAIGRHAEVLRDGLGGLRVRRIEPDLIRTQPRQRLDHLRRTAAGVFVLVKTEAVVELRGFLVVRHG